MSMQVDGAAMDSAATELRSALTAIEHELDQLALSVGTLREHWSGQAQRAFDIAHTQWSRRLTALADILGQAIGALEAANASAGEAESAAAALWR